MVRFFLCGFLIVLAVVDAWGQKVEQRWAEQLSNKEVFKTADLSISVMDIQRNEVLADLHSNLPLAPASSLKTLTTATALVVLGKDYRFKTELQTDGYIDATGILQGDVYIKGYGDPSLGSGREGVFSVDELLDYWCEQLVRAGIHGVAGDVLADDGWFGSSPLPEGWSEKDGGNYYAAGIWSLNIGENMYFLNFRQNPRIGGAVSILSVKPEVPDLKLTSYVTSGARGSGDNAYIYGLPYDFEREVRGTIPAGTGVFTIKGSLPDAPLFAAQQLRLKLIREGIPVRGKAGVWRKPKPTKPRETIATVFSPPLATLIEWTNRESLNLYAEAMLRAIGRERRGKGSVEDGVGVLLEVWRDRGLIFHSLSMYDGSGLSSKNRICAADLAALMRKVYVDERLRTDFLNSLPLAGRRGTLKQYFTNSSAQGRLYAKTGSMKGVRSLTGYVYRPSGKWLAFSLIVNNYSGSASTAWRELLGFAEQLSR